MDETSESHSRSPVFTSAKWKKKPRLWANFFHKKRSVVSTRPRAWAEEIYPRLWPMHRAVRLNPVAAMLATTVWSGPRTLQRSLTSPVWGLACSQKKAKFARSSSSRKLSSSLERGAPVAGVVGRDGDLSEA